MVRRRPSHDGANSKLKRDHCAFQKHLGEGDSDSEIVSQ